MPGTIQLIIKSTRHEAVATAASNKALEHITNPILMLQTTMSQSTTAHSACGPMCDCCRPLLAASYSISTPVHYNTMPLSYSDCNTRALTAVAQAAARLYAARHWMYHFRHHKAANNNVQCVHKAPDGCYQYVYADNPCQSILQNLQQCNNPAS